MRYSKIGMLIALTGLMGGGAAGCGDDGFECGDGTVEVDGKCLPTDSACADGTTYDMATRTCVADTDPPVTCGEGTILTMGECVTELDCGPGTSQMGNQCLPDGSVICTGNTVFDPETGTCVVDEGACADGTVLVDGECVPFDDTLVADIMETTEPNDPAFSETAMISPFDLPAIDATTSLGGCVEPTDFDEDGFTDADLDFFAFTITEPTVLEIQTDGIGGLSAGAIVISLEDQLADYIRGIVDNTNDGAQKTIYLPAAGEYAIAISDSRTLVPLLLEQPALPAGGAGACYFVQVTQRAIPAATAVIEDGMERVGTFGNAPTVYSVDVTEDSNLFLQVDELDAMDEPVDFIFIQADGRVNDADGSYAGGLFLPAAVGTGTARVVVESAFDLGLDPVEYRVRVDVGGRQDFPGMGDVTLTNQTGEIPNVNTFVPSDFDYLTFDVAAGEVIRFQASTAGGTAAALVLGPDGSLFAPCGFDGGFFGTGEFFTCDLDQYFYAPMAGTVQVGFYDDSVGDGEDFTVTVQRDATDPATLAPGTDGAADLSDMPFEFFEVDATSAEWWSYAVGALTNLTDVSFDFYAISEAEFGPLGSTRVPLADSEVTGDSFDRLYLTEGERYLLRVSDADTDDADESFTVSITDVAFNDLGTATEAAPAMAAGETLTAGDPNLYVVRAAAGSIVTVTATPTTIDVVLNRHDTFDATLDEAIDENGPDAAESFRDIADEAGVFVFSVADVDAVGGMVDIGVTVVDPVTYTETAGALTFTDVCPSGGGTGTVVDDYTATGSFPAEDDGWSGKLTLPFAFIFYGIEQTEAFIGTNGRIAFGSDAPTGAFPTFGGATGNDMLFPFSADLAVTETCVFHDTAAGQYVIQYSGTPWNGPDIVRFQVILDGAAQTVSYVYDATHELTDADATIGIQGPASILTTEATLPLAAGDSVVFTPM